MHLRTGLRGGGNEKLRFFVDFYSDLPGGGGQNGWTAFENYDDLQDLNFSIRNDASL